jgi:hypothetical protein
VVPAVAEAQEDDQAVVVLLTALENLPLTCLVGDLDLDAFCVNLHAVVGYCGYPCAEPVNLVVDDDLLAQGEMENDYHDLHAMEHDLHDVVAMENEDGDGEMHLLV